jgi:outer membrane receptor protein involved in Fe transport
VPIQFVLTGNPDEKAEKLLAFEAGMRGDLGAGWTFDIAMYRNSYRQLASLDVTSMIPLFVPPVPVPVGVSLTSMSSNRGRARSWGGEIVLNGQVMPGWKAELSYAYLDLHINVDPATGGTVLSPITDENSSRHQFHLRSTWDPVARLSVSAAFNYYGRSLDGSRPAVADLGARISYRPTTSIEISLVGNGLLQHHRLEYNADYTALLPSYVPRTGYLEARVRF